MWFVLFPLMARFEAPGPLIVRSLLINKRSVVKVTVAGYKRLKSIVSPETAFVIASRREPRPPSFVLVTVMVLPKAGRATTRETSRTMEHRTFFRLINEPPGWTEPFGLRDVNVDTSLWL